MFLKDENLYEEYKSKVLVDVLNYVKRARTKDLNQIKADITE